MCAESYYYDAVIVAGAQGELPAWHGRHCSLQTLPAAERRLWRQPSCVAYGGLAPEPKGHVSGFNVCLLRQRKYYAKAVAWAVENGITVGTTAAARSAG